MAEGDDKATTGSYATGNQAQHRPRVAMIFSSRFRQLTATGAAYAGSSGMVTSTNALTDPVVTQGLSFFGGSGNFMPSIHMAVNPNSIKWSQPKRFNKKDTRDGSVFFHFTNSKGQNNDILTLAFDGSTGNIDERGSPTTLDVQQGASAQDTGAVYKRQVWHNLYLMTREPMLLADGTENRFTIQYETLLFPQELTFYGFFNKVLEFTEDASRPHSRRYNFEFTVQSTMPDLDQVLGLLAASEGGFGNTVSANISNVGSGSVMNMPSPNEPLQPPQPGRAQQ